MVDNESLSLYHYAYIRKHFKEDTYHTYNSVILYQYILLHYYKNIKKDSKSIYLFIIDNFMDDDIDLFTLYYKPILEIFIKYLELEYEEKKSKRNYDLKLKIEGSDPITLKVRFYKRLDKEIFFNLIKFSTSPVFSTGDLSSLQALGLEKYFIGDYIENRKYFINFFIDALDLYIKDAYKPKPENKTDKEYPDINRMRRHVYAYELFHNHRMFDFAVKLRGKSRMTPDIYEYESYIKDLIDVFKTKIDDIIYIIDMHIYYYINKYYSEIILKEYIFETNFIELIKTTERANNNIFIIKYYKYKNKYLIKKNKIFKDII